MLDLQGDELGTPERTHVPNEDQRMVTLAPQSRQVTGIEHSVQHGAADGRSGALCLRVEPSLTGTQPADCFR